MLIDIVDVVLGVWNILYPFITMKVMLTVTRRHVYNQLSIEVQQDREIRMRVALGVYIIADRALG